MKSGPSIPLSISRSSGRCPALKRVGSLSFGEKHAGNALIRGDNLDTLAVLSPSLHDRVRCIYIDPPYNNQEGYTHYDDRLDHAAWLSGMRRVITALAELLTTDGSIWVSIDDRELHYLKVAMDDILGRQNFIATIVWEHRRSRENRKVFSSNHEYVLVYARDARAFGRARGRLPLSPEVAARYKNPDGDPRGAWQSVSANVQAGHGTMSQFYELVAPNGARHTPPNGRCWVYTQPRMLLEIARGNVWFGRDGNGVPRLKHFAVNGSSGMTPHTLWRAEEVGTTETAKKHLLSLLPDDPVFDTPKPEGLLKRVIEIATKPGELVLDAFLGSGTTAAVAHKLARRYIGIERGPHAATHAAARIRQVVHGEQGGISAEIGWQGGGGFDYYELESGVSTNGNGIH